MERRMRVHHIWIDFLHPKHIQNVTEVGYLVHIVLHAIEIDSRTDGHERVNLGLHASHVWRHGCEHYGAAKRLPHLCQFALLDFFQNVVDHRRQVLLGKVIDGEPPELVFLRAHPHMLSPVGAATLVADPHVLARWRQLAGNRTWKEHEWGTRLEQPWPKQYWLQVRCPFHRRILWNLEVFFTDGVAHSVSPKNVGNDVTMLFDLIQPSLLIGMALVGRYMRWIDKI